MTTTYRLPQLSAPTEDPSKPIEYEALEFPIPLEALLVDDRGRSDEEGAAYLEWVKVIEPIRTPYALKVLREAGARIPDRVDRSDDLIGTGRWIRRWWPIVMEAWKGVCWGDSGFGIPLYLVAPGQTESCDSMRRLELSMAHDLGFVLLWWVRQIRHDLEWTLVTRTEEGRVQRRLANVRVNLPTVDPNAPPLFRATLGVLRETLLTGTMLDEREEQDSVAGMRLARTYQRLLEPPVARRKEEAPERSRGRHFRASRRVPKPQYPTVQPARNHPAPALALVEAVASFRSAGWFARYRRLSDEALASQLSATWRAAVGDDLDLWPGALDWRLIVMDEERSWSSDVEADVAEGENVYAEILSDLARKSNGLFEVRRMREDWEDEPGKVLITFRSHGEDVRFSVPIIGDWIHPDVIHRVNALMEPEGEQFYFVDLNPQMAIVSRASVDERAALQVARPIELGEQSIWWKEMAASFEDG